MRLELRPMLLTAMECTECGGVIGVRRDDDYHATDSDIIVTAVTCGARQPFSIEARKCGKCGREYYVTPKPDEPEPKPKRRRRRHMPFEEWVDKMLATLPKDED